MQRNRSWRHRRDTSFSSSVPGFESRWRYVWVSSGGGPSSGGQIPVALCKQMIVLQNWIF